MQDSFREDARALKTCGFTSTSIIFTVILSFLHIFRFNHGDNVLLGFLHSLLLSVGTTVTRCRCTFDSQSVFHVTLFGHVTLFVLVTMWLVSDCVDFYTFPSSIFTMTLHQFCTSTVQNLSMTFYKPISIHNHYLTLLHSGYNIHI